jgi:hypothetical protein
MILQAWHLASRAKNSFLWLGIALLVLLLLLGIGVESFFSSLMVLCLSVLLLLIFAFAAEAHFFFMGLKYARNQAGVGNQLKWIPVAKLASVSLIDLIRLIIVVSVFVIALGLLVNLLWMVFPSLEPVTRLPSPPPPNPFLWYFGYAGMIFIALFLAIGASVFFSFAPLFVLDEGCSVHQALWRSSILSGRHFFKMYKLITQLLLCNVLGCCLFVVGLFWTIPLTYIGLGLAYDIWRRDEK